MNKLFCVDSDGSTMDTMSFKHEEIMAPNAVKIFNIAEHVSNIDGFLSDWSKVNLYSPLRGANRFVALAVMLEKIGYPHVENLLSWVKDAEQLSMETLEEEIKRTNAPDLKLAYQWSKQTNQDAKMYDQPYGAFPGAKETLKELAQAGTVYAVSTSNRKMISEEWIENGLDKYTTDYYCQEAGPKAHTINRLIQEGTNPRDIMVVGDSPGDLEAAKQNGVYFYPILVGKEEKSWKELRETALSEFVDGRYDQHHYIKIFKDNLSGN